MIPLLFSALATIWLTICAILDARTRQVSNWLTLPAILVALLAACLSHSERGETPFETAFHLALIVLPMFAAWSYHLLGGADFKILLALALIHPYLVAAAWLGVVAYFVGLLLISRSRPVRFAGVPGFAIGVGAFTIFQAVTVFTQSLPG